MIRIPLRVFQVPTFRTTVEHVMIMIIFFFIKLMKKMLLLLLLLQLADLLRLEQLVGALH
jgi:hypothetical protein